MFIIFIGAEPPQAHSVRQFFRIGLTIQYYSIISLAIITKVQHHHGLAAALTNASFQLKSITKVKAMETRTTGLMRSMIPSKKSATSSPMLS
jgi:hypothetical protein